MKSKFTAAVAVIVVAIMIGSALVPLTSDNSAEYSSAAISDNSQYTNTGGTSLEDLLGKIASVSSNGDATELETSLSDYMSTELAENFLSYAASKLSASDSGLFSGASVGDSIVDISKMSDTISDLGDLSDVSIDMSILSDLASLFENDSVGSTSITSRFNYSLIPVAHDDSYTGMVQWDGTTTTSGQVVGLYDDAVVTLTYTNGLISEGSTLVLFPLGDVAAVNNYNFTITSADGYTHSIEIESGAYIDILGMKFKVMCGSSGYSDIEFVTMKGTVSVNSAKATDSTGFHATLSLGANTLCEFISTDYYFANESESASTPITISSSGMSKDGTGKRTFSDIGITANSSVKYSNTLSSTVYSMTLSASTKELSITATPGANETTGVTTVDFKSINVDYEVKTTEEIREKMDTLVITEGSATITSTGDKVQEDSLVKYSYGYDIVLTPVGTGSITANSLIVDRYSELTDLDVTLSGIRYENLRDSINDVKRVKMYILGDAALTGDLEYSKTNADSSTSETRTLTVIDIACTLNDLKIDSLDGTNELTSITCDSFEASASSAEYTFTVTDSGNTSGTKFTLDEPSVELKSEGLSVEYSITKVKNTDETYTETKLLTVNGEVEAKADLSIGEDAVTVDDIIINVKADIECSKASTIDRSYGFDFDKIVGTASASISTGNILAENEGTKLGSADAVSLAIAVTSTLDLKSTSQTAVNADITLSLTNAMIDNASFGDILKNVSATGVNASLELIADLYYPGAESKDSQKLSLAFKNSTIEATSISAEYGSMAIDVKDVSVNATIGGIVNVTINRVDGSQSFPYTIGFGEATFVGGSASVMIASIDVNTTGTEPTPIFNVDNLGITVEDLMYSKSTSVTEDKGETVTKTTTEVETKLQGKLSAGFTKLNISSDLLSSFVPGLSFEDLGLTISDVEVAMIQKDTTVEETGQATVKTSTFDVNTCKIGEFTISVGKLAYTEAVNAVSAVSIPGINVESFAISLKNVDITAHQNADDDITVAGDATLSIGVGKADITNIDIGSYLGMSSGNLVIPEIILDDASITLALSDVDVALLSGTQAAGLTPSKINGTVTLTIANEGLEVIDYIEDTGETTRTHDLILMDNYYLSISVAVAYDMTDMKPVVVTVTVNTDFENLKVHFMSLTIPSTLTGLSSDITLENVGIKNMSMAVEDLKIVVTYPLPTATGDAATQNPTVEITLASEIISIEEVSAEYPMATQGDGNNVIISIKQINYLETGVKMDAEFTVDLSASSPVNPISIAIEGSELFSIGSISVDKNGANIVTVTKVAYTISNMVIEAQQDTTASVPVITASVKADKIGFYITAVKAVNDIADISDLSFEIVDLDASAEGSLAIGDSSSPVDVKNASVKGAISLSAKKISIDTTTLALVITDVPVVTASVIDFNLAVSDIDASYDKAVDTTTVETFKVKGKISLSFNDLNVIEPQVPAAGIDLAIKDLTIDATVTNTTTVAETTTTVSSEKADLGLASLSLHVDSAVVSGVSLTDATLTVSDVAVKFEGEKDSSSSSTKVKYLNVKISVGLEVKSIVIYQQYDPETVVTLELTDAKLKLINATHVMEYVTLEGTAGKVPLTMTGADLVSVSATVAYEPLLKKFTPAVSAEITNFKWTQPTDADQTVTASKVAVNATVRYDGIDRSIAVDANDFELAFESMSSITALKFKVSVKGDLSVFCDVPFATMGLSDTLSINVNPNIVLTGSNIVFDSTSGLMALTADSLTATSKTTLSYAPYFEEISVTAENLVSDVMTTCSAESVSGYLKNYGEDKQNFTVSNSPTFSLSTKTTQASIAIVIEKGDAVFAAGYLPLTIVVGADATFKASGLSADSFVFKDASKATGTISMATNENYNLITRTITVADKPVVTLNAYKEYLRTDGYKLSFDLATQSGTFTAEKGTQIPDWKTEFGNTEWVRSEDHTTATFTAIADGTVYKFETDPLSYNFAYSGGESVAKKYGETFNLAEIPAKEGYRALGWSDGTENIYAAGASYRMPARDVILTAVYANDNPTVVEEDKVVNVKAAEDTSTVAKASDISKVQNDGALSISVKGAVVNMPKSTVDGLKSEYAATKPSSDLNLVLSVVKVTEIDDEVMKTVVAGNEMYSITLVADDGSEFTYANNQVFIVTITVSSDKPLENCDVKFVGTEGSHSVGVLGFVDNGDGTYDVTFECNHFSDYMIEPVYKVVPEPTKEESLIGLYVALILIVLIALGILAMNFTKKDKQ